MSVSKEYLPPSAESPSAPKPKPDLYRRVVSRLPGLVLRPWVQQYMLNRRVQMMIDAVIASACFVFAHILRFDGWPPGIEDDRMFLVLPYLVAARISANYWLGLYLRVWRYISIPDAIHLAGSVGLISSVLLLLMRLGFTGVSPYLTAPIGVIIIDFVLTTSMMLCARLLWRVTCETAASAKTPTKEKRLRTLLVGAGSAGIMTAREISRRRDLGMQVCGFLDDDYSKQKSVIQGVSVLGGSADLPFVVRSYRIDQVIITMANAHRKMIRNLIDLCDAARVPVKIIPKLHEILGNQVTISNLRPVEIEDLLGRDSIDVDAWLEASQGSYRGKRVLITGAGGSIGRELCRQLATLNPASIILLDKDENSVFEAERELRLSADREIKIIPVICDLRMASRLGHVFKQQAPQVVFHAAAHKHVPLLESNTSEAVLNNILGTAQLLRCAADHQVERCVMVSSDKAVNPTNIMGATKRVAELMFQAQALRLNGKSHYSCVRFGNVLGSRGSVVPIFREQIKQGGPVTVTDPDVERYFMTIPEAAQLIIQAGAMGQRGEIFLLDMGEPVKVVDLARDMIRLSGLTIGEDVDIEFIGLRPGEKLKEELLIADEGARTTRYEKIFIAPPLKYDFAALEEALRHLTAAVEEGNDERIYQLFLTMGIGFRPHRPEKEKGDDSRPAENRAHH